MCAGSAESRFAGTGRPKNVVVQLELKKKIGNGFEYGWEVKLEWELDVELGLEFKLDLGLELDLELEIFSILAFIKTTKW